jgi:DNA invertase Pin-like site-specific DNA recombinase
MTSLLKWTPLSRQFPPKARAEGHTGGRPPKRTKQQRQDIADNVLSGRKSGADMARLYNISETTVFRIVSRARQAGVPG